MKLIPIITLFATAACLVTPKAKADDEGRALLGGLIGGIIIGSVLADDDPHFDAAVTVGFDRNRHGGGYYKWVTVKTWVPGYHEHRRDHCGNRYRVWIAGHYSYTKQKVWVNSGHHGRPDYGRHDRYRDNDRHDDRYRKERGRYDDNRYDRDRRDGRHSERASNRF